MPDRLIHTIDSKRGGFIFIMSFAYLTLGLSQAFAPSHAQELVFAWLPEHFNHDELGAIMATVGVVGLVYSAGYSKKYPGGEGLMFSLLIALPALWGLIHLGSTVFGNHNALPLALVYLFWSAVIFHVSGWPNPIQRDKRVDL